LDYVSDKITPIVIRLSGHAQVNDRLALREISWQLNQQTGNTILSEKEDESEGDDDGENLMPLPPPAHLPALISLLPSQPRPVIVILDAFDWFALHGRQALLYCLLDTAQSCRVGEAANGIAVIGVTSRIDTINLLEKRVKSRFSGRMFRTAGVRQWAGWVKITRRVLTISIEGNHAKEWSELWEASVDRFLNDQKVIDMLHETWALLKDLRVLVRILVCCAWHLF
jgi:origin recognition complex subunit 4